MKYKIPFISFIFLLCFSFSEAQENYAQKIYEAILAHDGPKCRELLIKSYSEFGIDIGKELRFRENPYTIPRCYYDSLNDRITYPEMAPVGRGKDYFNNFSKQFTGNTWKAGELVSDPNELEALACFGAMLVIARELGHYADIRYPHQKFTEGELEWRANVVACTMMDYYSSYGPMKTLKDQYAKMITSFHSHILEKNRLVIHNPEDVNGIYEKNNLNPNLTAPEDVNGVLKKNNEISDLNTADYMGKFLAMQLSMQIWLFKNNPFHFPGEMFNTMFLDPYKKIWEKIPKAKEAIEVYTMDTVKDFEVNRELPVKNSFLYTRVYLGANGTMWDVDDNETKWDRNDLVNFSDHDTVIFRRLPYDEFNTEEKIAMEFPGNSIHKVLTDFAIRNENEIYLLLTSTFDHNYKVRVTLRKCKKEGADWIYTDQNISSAFPWKYEQFEKFFYRLLIAPSGKIFLFTEDTLRKPGKNSWYLRQIDMQADSIGKEIFICDSDQPIVLSSNFLATDGNRVFACNPESNKVYAAENGRVYLIAGGLSGHTDGPSLSKAKFYQIHNLIINGDGDLFFIDFDPTPEHDEYSDGVFLLRKIFWALD